MHLANLSCTQLELIELGAWAAPNVALARPDTVGPDDYFPDRALARRLVDQVRSSAHLDGL